ncbi:transducin/WD40 repeat protein [Trifolium medium]|uniref:Transducin/WD40 repeat protein n=1 Tax=Trifolium medium TaxID=97028 RepID=A0A392U591_9FABA|nr:transducin/WD40 repeat protein [Trifolium medium]
MKIYPTAIAAHPQKPNQFAAGFTDGSVCVFEPKEPPSGNWIMPQV